MTELPIILDNFIEEELQDQIEDSMFSCDWTYVNDNTIDVKSKYNKFLSPFEYEISPSIITNILKNQKATKLISQVIKKTCNHIDFNPEKINRCIAGIQGVQVIRKQNKVCNIHINNEHPHLVLLYYVNDADGETILYDKTLDDIESENKIYLDDEYKFNVVKKK